MISRLAIAAALGLAALIAPADAQSTAQVLPSCGSASLPLGPGGRLYTDQAGNLCTAGGGGGGGSVTQGTSPWVISGNSTANGSGNPIFASITNLPATAVGTQAGSALTVQGNPNGIPQPVNLLATTTAGPTPVTTTGSSVVGKASAGNLYGFSVTASGTAAYLAILNATAAPASGAAIAPLECIPVAVNSYVARRQDIPDRYTSGIVAVVSSSCTTFTAVAPQVVSLIVQ